jgi:hypothetical protein
MMTKKDYKLIAIAIYNAGKKATPIEIVESISDALADENWKFDALKFFLMTRNGKELKEKG